MAQPQMTEAQRKELEEKIKNMSPEELKEFQKQQCIFCQIIAGKIPSKKIYEDKQCLAILDINPAAKGHVLILPKEHYAIMPQMPDFELEHLFLVAKQLSQIVLKTLKVAGTNIFVANGLVAGQKAQHFMVHLIPRKEGDGLINFEEKIVDEKLRQQVLQVVGTRFNELMGIKKEIVDMEKEVPEKISDNKKTKKKIVKKKKEEVVDEVEEVEDIEDDADDEDDEETDDPEEDSAKDENDDEIDLDDIAGMFK